MYDHGRDGGPRNDSLFGNTGNDRISGGDGVDDIAGNDGNDTLCDTAKDSTGTCTANEVNGGTGNNKIWLEYDASCDPAGDWATADAGSGVNDDCGDVSGTTWTAWAGCDNPITTIPSTCP